jgi:hypothetical protein
VISIIQRHTARSEECLESILGFMPPPNDSHHAVDARSPENIPLILNRIGPGDDVLRA